MARLSHANVVAIHEVGEADGKVFIAMEFVRGESLVAHCMPLRPWAEVAQLYIQAGRGLIAAHDAGLVHRDLKPHNIIRGDDGVVKVLDFGLARADSKSTEFEVTDQRAALSPSVRGSTSGSVLDAHLTHAGALLGTPAYMAPRALRRSQRGHPQRSIQLQLKPGVSPDTELDAGDRRRGQRQAR